MRKIIAVLLFLLSGVTLAVEVPALLGAEFPDTDGDRVAVRVA